MLAKIKNLLSKVTIIEWVLFGVAVAALVVAFSAHGKRPPHKGPRGGHETPKAVEAK
jgi:hypothetical protein